MATLAEFVQEGLTRKPITLMTHIVVGFPSLEDNWAVLEQMERAGVEVVEFQFPFSEPVADGPVFAQANQDAIERGITIEDCFELISKASKKFSFKILMMGYYNTIFKMGEAMFCHKLKAVGAAGMIVADLPLEESVELRTLMRSMRLELISLVTPTTTDARLQKLADVANQGQGLVYAVARKGVTGKNTDLSASLDPYFAKLKGVFKVPVAVGFGISSREDVDALVGKVDMAILGTQVLRIFQDKGLEAVGNFLLSLRDGDHTSIRS